jgi:heat shock protein HslJ
MIRTLLFILLIVAFGDCAAPLKTGNNISQQDNIVVNKSLALQPDKFETQFAQGIDFIATGNEPFWKLEIDFDKFMHFKMLDGFEITTAVGEGIKAIDANVIRYAANNEKGALTVQIQKLTCINNMSGEKLGYTVTVDTKNKADKNYLNYKGCGQYIADYRLHDIWVLDSINNKRIKPDDFTKKLPYLELNLKEKKVFGSTGCNTISGPIKIMGKKIYIGKLATTRMACKDTDFEKAYLQGLENKIIPYKTTTGKLYLQVSTGEVFIYKKTD